MKSYLITYVYEKMNEGGMFEFESWEIDTFEVKAENLADAREEAAKWGIHQITDIMELPN